MSKTSSYIIYGLIDPRNQSIRYIGKSIQGEKRIKEHIKPSALKNESNTKKTNWILSLKKQGLIYDHVILKTLDPSLTKGEANLLLYLEEQTIITELKELGIDLVNGQDGGPGSPDRKLSLESKKKMSESAKRRGIHESFKLNQVRVYPEGHSPSDLKRKYNVYPDNRKIKGKNLNVISSKPVIAMSPFTGDCYHFSSARLAARSIGTKCNKTGINRAMKNKTIYYNYYWINPNE